MSDVWVPEDLLGVVPDRVLAERYGAERHALGLRRAELGIEPCKQYRATLERDATVAAALAERPGSLADVAARTGLPVGRTLRRSLARVGVYSPASDVWRLRR